MVCLCEPWVSMHTQTHIRMCTLDPTNLYHSSSQGPVICWRTHGYEEIEASVEVSVSNRFALLAYMFLFSPEQFHSKLSSYTGPPADLWAKSCLWGFVVGGPAELACV